MKMANEAASTINITLAYSPAPRVLHELALLLPADACVSDALAAGVQDQRFASLSNAEGVGIWGKKASSHQTLVEGDRVEIYRPLRVDPKVARRERFKQQGAKSAGLFAQRRPGAKAGY